jgi:hypothetical protein
VTVLKVLVFLFGLAAGGSGAAAWLLSEPGPAAPPSPPLAPESLEVRLSALRIRFQQALAEGERAGGETEERLRRELGDYRKNPERAAAP